MARRQLNGFFVCWWCLCACVVGNLFENHGQQNQYKLCANQKTPKQESRRNYHKSRAQFGCLFTRCDAVRLSSADACHDLRCRDHHQSNRSQLPVAAERAVIRYPKNITKYTRPAAPQRYQKYHTFHTCGVTPSAINTRILHAHCADIYFQRGECACADDEDDASSIQIAGVSNTSPRARLVGVVTLIWGPLVVRRHRGDTASSRRMRVHARAFGPTPNKGESMRRGLTEHATARKMCTLQTHAPIPKHSARTHASARVHASTTSTQPAQRVQEI